jgi:hypothetical protein
MQSDLIIDALVLTAVLEADLGSHRKIGKFRIVRPLLIAGAILPLYLKTVSMTAPGSALRSLSPPPASFSVSWRRR